VLLPHTFLFPRIYLPDPVKFFELLHPHNLDSSLNSAKAFFGKQGKGHPTAGQTMLQQAAFGLLQWAQNGETFDFSSNEEKDSSSEDDVDMVVVEDRGEDYDPTDEEEAEIKTDGLVTRPTILQGMDTPDDFRATLRPYQRQALWWMTQREAQQELEDSSKQQLELLEELVQSTPLPCRHTSSPIHCECGPVQVDTSQTQAPAVVSDDERSPDMKHPLWERRFLTNPSKTKALSFYVQPLFGAAMAGPPEPPRACRGGILADSMGLVSCPLRPAN
jgi:SNF2 family DNA or RNA helicase